MFFSLLAVDLEKFFCSEPEHVGREEDKTSSKNKQPKHYQYSHYHIRCFFFLIDVRGFDSSRSTG